MSYQDCLAEDFMHYFPDNTLDNPVWKLVRNPFNVDEDSSPDPVHVQAVKLKSDSSTNDNFETVSLEEFWVKYLPIFPNAGQEALRLIIPFSYIYLCESVFMPHCIKNKTAQSAGSGK
jgi:hypothetical protein